MKIPSRDRDLEPILDELRQNFDRAMNLDVQGLRERVELLEAENRGLRGELVELKQGFELLRHIASEHEERLKLVEKGATVTAAVRRTA
ncbi:MAG: hypothetical protein ABIJ09_06315 [Pseudomonadota bacterium]